MIAESPKATLTSIPAPPDLYPRQLEAICDPARFVVIEASTKSGKTAGCIAWQYTQCTNVVGLHLWVEPTYAMAKKLGYERVRNMMIGADPEKRIWDSSDTELEIRFINGSVWRFKGADNPDGIYGDDVSSCVIDEASRCTEAAWHAVRSTLTSTQGPCRIIGNVRGRKNWAYQLGQKAKSGEPNYGYHKLTAIDAIDGGIFPEDELKQAKRDLPEDVFKQLYMAEPADDGGNPFGIDAIAKCIGMPSYELPVCFGVDLAKSEDWTVVVGLDAAGKVCVLERWQSDWRTTRERLTKLIGRVPALIDSTGVGDPITEDLQSVLPDCEGFKFTSQSKQQLMDGLRAAIHETSVTIPDGWLRIELESFEYEYTSSGVRYSAPSGLHDDGVCALALAIRRKGSAARNTFRFSIR